MDHSGVSVPPYRGVEGREPGGGESRRAERAGGGIEGTMGDADVDDLLEAPFKDDADSKEDAKSGRESREEKKERNGDEKDRKSSKKSKKRSRSRSKDRKDRKKSRSRSRTPKKKSKKRSRSRSRSKSKSKSKSRKKHSRSRSRSHSRSPLRGGWAGRGGGSWGGGGGGGWGGGGGGWGGGGGGWGGGGGAWGGGGGSWGGGGGGGGDRWARSPPRGRLPGPERRDVPDGHVVFSVGGDKRSVMPFSPRRSPPRGFKEDMSTEERDARTIFVMQIAARTKPRDLEEFFGSVGHVRDVRIITDSKTRRSKGIAYVEFWELEAVPLAIGLNGQRLLGAPLIIQASQADRNRMASSGTVGGVPGFGFEPQSKGPMKLYVGSLHFNITEDMLKGIFEPFGRIDRIELMTEPDSGKSRGYGFVTYAQSDDAKRAMEQLNGFELAGRPIKGTGLQLPNQAQQVLNLSNQQALAPPIATQCFMLSNMFDPDNETESGWENDIKDDVIEECSKNGGLLHIFVDKAAKSGNVYVKCPSVSSAVAAVNSLHGRWFAGKIITANYVPVNNYHQLFPDSARNAQPLRPAYKP